MIRKFKPPTAHGINLCWAWVWFSSPYLSVTYDSTNLKAITSSHLLPWATSLEFQLQSHFWKERTNSQARYKLSTEITHKPTLLGRLNQHRHGKGLDPWVFTLPNSSNHLPVSNSETSIYGYWKVNYSAHYRNMCSCGETRAWVCHCVSIPLSPHEPEEATPSPDGTSTALGKCCRGTKAWKQPQGVFFRGGSQGGLRAAG